MDTEALLQRAQLLLAQDRHAQAEQVVGQVLAQDPESWHAHGIMALCLSMNRDRLSEATHEAEQAVHFAPYLAWPHYVLSIIWEKRNQGDKALDAIQQAISLDTEDADYHGMAAYLLNKQHKWQQGLEAAERGLALDAEHEQCSAARTLSLERLGKTIDALSEADRAVRNAPGSAIAHASRGWALVNSGKYKEAQIAFREALRLDPSSEFARSGMIQALNGSNIIFRMVHQLMIWISRKGENFRWVIVVVAYVGFKILNNIAAQAPAFKPWVSSLSAAYIMLVLMTWMLYPLFNTMLRFHPFGKHLLSRSETWASNVIASVIVLAFVVGISSFVLYHSIHDAVFLSIMMFMMVIPIVTAFNCAVVWARTVAIACAVGFFLLYSLICFQVLNGESFPPLAGLYIIGLVIYSFAGGYLQSRQVTY